MGEGDPRGGDPAGVSGGDAQAAGPAAAPRHLGFIETGRSTPSPAVLLSLAEQPDVPLRERTGYCWPIANPNGCCVPDPMLIRPYIEPDDGAD